MIEAGLRSLLLTKSEVTNLVGSVVRVVKLREKDTFPAVTITCQNSEHLNDLSGLGGLVKSDVQFLCMAKTLEEARELAKQVRLTISGYKGPALAEDITAVVVDTTTSDWVSLDDASDTGVYSVDLNCTVWHHEAVPT